MAKKPETAFKEKVLADLRTIDCWAKKMDHVSLRGIPDIIGCLGGGIFFAIELKMPGSEPDPLQKYNIFAIRATKSIALTAYPQTWPQIFEILKKVVELNKNRRVKFPELDMDETMQLTFDLSQ